jgi:NADP-dependent 3-hydroxy acid dehydrogenase YdfG
MSVFGENNNPMMGAVMPQPPSSLAGKIALVTGAGIGLGKQISKQLAAQGVHVVLMGRTRATLDEVACELETEALVLTADVSDPDQVRAAFAAIDDRFGRIDILVNNAAVYVPFTIDQASDENLRQVIDTNFLGAAYCTREAVVRMKANGSGDILSISSESAFNPFPYLTVYAASKSALETFMRGQRAELIGTGIRVMILRTGFMAGEGASNGAAQWSEQQLGEALALWEKTGHKSGAIVGMSPATVATAVVNALTLPRDANTDLIELRGLG